MKAEIKHVECDRNLGGRDLDRALMQFCIKEFQEEEGFEDADLMNKPKA